MTHRQATRLSEETAECWTATPPRIKTPCSMNWKRRPPSPTKTPVRELEERPRWSARRGGAEKVAMEAVMAHGNDQAQQGTRPVPPQENGSTETSVALRHARRHEANGPALRRTWSKSALTRTRPGRPSTRMREVGMHAHGRTHAHSTWRARAFHPFLDVDWGQAAHWRRRMALDDGRARRRSPEPSRRLSAVNYMPDYRIRQRAHAWLTLPTDPARTLRVLRADKEP